MLLRSLLVPIFLCLALTACDSAEEKAEAHYERGLELLAEGDSARAKVEFRNALKEVNTMIEPRLELARLNLKEKAFRPAFRDYMRIAEQDPTNQEATIILGELSFVGQNWEAFDRYAAAAVEMDPDNPRVRVLDLAIRYRDAAQEQDDPARSALVTEAEVLQEESPDSEILRGILIDGYLANDRLADTLVQIEKSIEANPDQIQFYNLRLQILAQMGEENEIENELQRMVKLFPKEDAVQSNLLRFLISRDKIDEAEALLRELDAAAPEGDNSAFVALIQFLLQMRDADAAMAELDAKVADKQDAYTLRTLRASLQFDSGARSEAISEMQSIVDTASADTGALPEEELENIKVALANMLAQDGNEVGARRLVEEILETNPEVVGALKMQARWMITEDDTDGAINAMRLVLAKSDQDFDAMTIMAEAYQRAGKQDLMMNFLSLAAEASNNAPEQALRYAAALRADDKQLQAENVLISSLRIQPNNIDVLATLGRIYLELDDLARARQVADTLRRLDDGRATAIATGIDLELLSRESGGAEMMAQLKSLAEQDTDGNGAKISLIQALMQNGEAEEALVLINELVADKPNNLTFIYLRGLGEALTGDIDAAKQTFIELTEKNPSADLGWIQLARLQTVDSDPGEVLQTIEAGLEANPGSPDLLWAKASYLQEQDDIDGAITIYEELYEMNSSSQIIANNLASLLTTFRDDEASLERARVIARRLNGTDIPAFQDTYGWILFRSGETSEALKYLEPAAKGLPEDASVQFHLGEAYNALGRRTDALAQMRMAMEKIGPLGSGALTDKIRERIAELETSPEN